MGADQEDATEVGAEPAISVKFYCMVKQLVLLFGAKMWVLSAPMSQRIEGVPETVDEVKSKNSEV